MKLRHDALGARGHRRHRRTAVARGRELRDVRRQLLAPDVRLEADRRVDAGVDHEHLDAVLEQPVGKERVFGPLRVERAEQDDDGHQARSLSGSTPRKRR